MSFNTFASSTLNSLMHSVPLPRVYREVEISENAKRYLHKVIDYDFAEAFEHAEPIDSDLVNASIKAAEHAELTDSDCTEAFIKLYRKLIGGANPFIKDFAVDKLFDFNYAEAPKIIRSEYPKFTNSGYANTFTKSFERAKTINFSGQKVFIKAYVDAEVIDFDHAEDFKINGFDFTTVVTSKASRVAKRYLNKINYTDYADSGKITSFEDAELIDFGSANLSKIKASENVKCYLNKLVDSDYVKVFKINSFEHAELIDFGSANLSKIKASEDVKCYLNKLVDSDYVKVFKINSFEHAELIDFGSADTFIKAFEDAEFIDFGSADLSKIKAFDNHALAYVVKHAEKHLLFLVLAPEYPFEERNLKGPKNQALVWYIPKGAGGPGSADQQFNTRDIEPTYQAETYMDLLPVLPRVPIF